MKFERVYWGYIILALEVAVLMGFFIWLFARR